MPACPENISRRKLLFGAVAFVVVSCTKPYQIGDYVLVEWGEDKLLYPAYIVEKRGKSQFRVHYEGYASRWDEVVPLPRIKGRVMGKGTPPPPPRKVRVAHGLAAEEKGANAPVSQFKVGDRVMVKWRESTYRANVIEIVSTSELKVHYEGHETAWDEIIPVSRIVDQ